MKTTDQILRIIRISSLLLTVSISATILFARPASAQSSCSNDVGPAQTINFTQGSSGTTGTNFQGPFSGAFSSYSESTNSVQAVSWTLAAIAGGAIQSASATLVYCFVVTGTANDAVPATISAQVSWNGLLGTVSTGPHYPSVTGTLSLVDLTTGGLVASVQAFQENPGTYGVSVAGIGANVGYTITSGSAPAAMQTQVTIGHTYGIEYNLDCESPPGLAGVAECNFAQQNTNAPPSGWNVFPIGNYGSTVNSVAITTAPDIYAAVLANRQQLQQDMESEQLTLEQENAQLLGLLNQIESQLSKSQPADPPPPASNLTPPKSPNSACSSTGNSGHTGGFLYRWFSAIFKRQQACP